MKEIDLIALAGLLHDIGKFGQRAEIPLREPFKRNIYKHRHSAYTHQILLDYFNDIQNYHQASYEHHVVNQNSDIDSWIVATADRLASGFEREKFEEYNEFIEEEVNTSFREQKLDHIFCKKGKFPINTLKPTTIFSDLQTQEGYSVLWDKFVQELETINNIEHFPLNLKIDSLEYLLKKYCSFIPSSTSFKSNYDNSITKANIPLYEHLKTTSLFASTIASMDNQSQKEIISYYKDNDKSVKNNKQFLLINGDFFGIQSFIFDDIQAKFASKTLRAKSAFVQIIVKVLSYYVCETLELSRFAIISTHAGKFEILAPNNEKIIKKLEQIQQDLNSYFVNVFYGQTGVGIAWCEASIEDFINTEKYNIFRKKLASKVEMVKLKKYDLLNKGAIVFDIEKDLNNKNLCNFCNKRKGIKKENYVICSECNKFVKIGQLLTKATYIAFSKKKKDDNDIEIFNGYYLHFFNKPSSKEAKDDIAIFDISNDDDFKGFAKWELRSYVANEKNLNALEKNYIEEKSKEEVKEILTLNQLALLSVKDGLDAEEQSYTLKRKNGVEALMALKGDVDFMGNFIQDSNNNITNSFAKYNFFARMIDYYFSVYVPYMMQNKYKNTYTVFAGGDDLFVLGAWDEVLELSKIVRDDFVKFTCEKLSFSVGLVMTKANKPINFIAKVAEDALESSKDYKKEQNYDDKEKNAITLFNETISWIDYEDCKNDFKLIKEMAIKYPEEFNTTFWYRILDFCDMQKQIPNDPAKTIWKSKLRYIFNRNIISKHKNENFDKVIELIDKNIETYEGAFKIIISEFIYKRRTK